MQQSVQFHGLLKTPAPNEMNNRFSLRNGVQSCYCMVGEHIIGMGWLLENNLHCTTDSTCSYPFLVIYFPNQFSLKYSATNQICMK